MLGCYFCPINTNGIKPGRIGTPPVPRPSSPRRPGLTGKIPYQLFTELSRSDDGAPYRRAGIYRRRYEAKDSPRPFSQCELNDLVGGSQLVEDSPSCWPPTQRKNLLGKDRVSLSLGKGLRPTGATSARGRPRVLPSVAGVFLVKLGAPQYDPRDWRLFFDTESAL
ncbi:hypothetical protein GWK47_032990 [Chionoecetes opilio]|uniref:Uncharacterized protein n=1 Tax=Chionoecetes opilio TaxID=41210 RepID=A0A8J4YJE3_CHIOP|nr:hypothetical protein GWK47_032990 [Chionoecetes opilio]